MKDLYQTGAYEGSRPGEEITTEHRLIEESQSVPDAVTKVAEYTDEAVFVSHAGEATEKQTEYVSYVPSQPMEEHSEAPTAAASGSEMTSVELDGKVDLTSGLSLNESVGVTGTVPSTATSVPSAQTKEAEEIIRFSEFGPKVSFETPSPATVGRRNVTHKITAAIETSEAKREDHITTIITPPQEVSSTGFMALNKTHTAGPVLISYEGQKATPKATVQYTFSPVESSTDVSHQETPGVGTIKKTQLEQTSEEVSVISQHTELDSTAPSTIHTHKSVESEPGKAMAPHPGFAEETSTPEFEIQRTVKLQTESVAVSPSMEGEQRLGSGATEKATAKHETIVTSSQTSQPIHIKTPIPADATKVQVIVTSTETLPTVLAPSAKLKPGGSVAEHEIKTTAKPRQPVTSATPIIIENDPDETTAEKIMIIDESITLPPFSVEVDLSDTVSQLDIDREYFTTPTPRTKLVTAAPKPSLTHPKATQRALQGPTFSTVSSSATDSPVPVEPKERQKPVAIDEKLIANTTAQMQPSTTDLELVSEAGKTPTEPRLLPLNQSTEDVTHTLGTKIHVVHIHFDVREEEGGTIGSGEPDITKFLFPQVTTAAPVQDAHPSLSFINGKTQIEFEPPYTRGEEARGDQVERVSPSISAIPDDESKEDFLTIEGRTAESQEPGISTESSKTVSSVKSPSERPTVTDEQRRIQSSVAGEHWVISPSTQDAQKTPKQIFTTESTEEKPHLFGIVTTAPEDVTPRKTETVTRTEDIISRGTIDKETVEASVEGLVPVSTTIPGAPHKTTSKPREPELYPRTSEKDVKQETATPIKMDIETLSTSGPGGEMLSPSPVTKLVVPPSIVVPSATERGRATIPERQREQTEAVTESYDGSEGKTSKPEESTEELKHEVGSITPSKLSIRRTEIVTDKPEWDSSKVTQPVEKKIHDVEKIKEATSIATTFTELGSGEPLSNDTVVLTFTEVPTVVVEKETLQTPVSVTTKAAGERIPDDALTTTLDKQTHAVRSQTPSVISESKTSPDKMVVESTVKHPTIEVLTEKSPAKEVSPHDFESSGAGMFTVSPDVHTLEVSSHESPVTSRTLLDEITLHSAVPAATDQDTGIATSGLPEAHTQREGLLVKVHTEVEDKTAATVVVSDKETGYTLDSVAREIDDGVRPVTASTVIKERPKEFTSEGPSVITELKTSPEKKVTASTLKPPAIGATRIMEKISAKPTPSPEIVSSREEVVTSKHMVQFGPDDSTLEMSPTLLPVTKKTLVDGEAVHSTAAVIRESEEESSGSGLPEVHTVKDGLLVKVHTQLAEKSTSTVIVDHEETRYTSVSVTTEVDDTVPHDTVTPVIVKTPQETSSGAPSVIVEIKTTPKKVVTASTMKPPSIDESGITEKVSDEVPHSKVSQESSSDAPSVTAEIKTTPEKVVVESTVKPPTIDESGITEKVAYKLTPSPDLESSGEGIFTIRPRGRFDPDVSTPEVSRHESTVTSRTSLDGEVLHSAVPVAPDRETGIPTSGLTEAHTRTEGFQVKDHTEVEDKSAATVADGDKETYTFDSVDEGDHTVTVAPVIKKKLPEFTSEAPPVITEIKTTPEKVVTKSTVRSPVSSESGITPKVSVKLTPSPEFESSGEELITSGDRMLTTGHTGRFEPDVSTLEMRSTLSPVSSKVLVDTEGVHSTVIFAHERVETHTLRDGSLVKVSTQTTNQPASTVVVGDTETKYTSHSASSEIEEGIPQYTVTPAIAKVSQESSSDAPSVTAEIKTIPEKVVVVSTVKPPTIDRSGITEKVADKLTPSPDLESSGEGIYTIKYTGRFDPDVSSREVSRHESPVTTRASLDGEILQSVVPATPDQETGLPVSGLPEAHTQSAATVMFADKETRYTLDSVTSKMDVGERPVTGTWVMKEKSEEFTLETPSVTTEVKTIPEKAVTARTVKYPATVESGITERVSDKLTPSLKFEGSGEELITSKQVVQFGSDISMGMSSTFLPVTSKTLMDGEVPYSTVAVTGESEEHSTAPGWTEATTEGVPLIVYTQVTDESATSTVADGDKVTRYASASVTSVVEERDPHDTVTPAIEKKHLNNPHQRHRQTSLRSKPPQRKWIWSQLGYLQ
ncbi:mucin-17-like [Leucoraja erinacea]|uniref:mucin-17-like n=1 Tax=Leucoraja erinaceus TaxID=7782 RepID=UPI002456246D|nr:mucin-17-like [Leucoraja erinacea]